MRAGDWIELRGDIPRDVADVLDAVSMANSCSRIDVVNEILHEWASERVHEASVIMRVTRGNPPAGEARSHADAGGQWI